MPSSDRSRMRPCPKRSIQTFVFCPFLLPSVSKTCICCTSSWRGNYFRPHLSIPCKCYNPPLISSLAPSLPPHSLSYRPIYLWTKKNTSDKMRPLNMPPPPPSPHQMFLNEFDRLWRCEAFKIKKITVNVKRILTRAGLLKAGLDNSGLVRNLNQQFDDWMLLKITEKIIRENAFEKTPEKQTRVKFNPGLSAIYI